VRRAMHDLALSRQQSVPVHVMWASGNAFASGMAGQPEPPARSRTSNAPAPKSDHKLRRCCTARGIMLCKGTGHTRKGCKWLSRSASVHAHTGQPAHASISGLQEEEEIMLSGI